MDANELIFSYGTLRHGDVQKALFGRVIAVDPDRLVGYRLGEMQITDPDVVRLSGSAVHPVLEESGRSEDWVDGATLAVTGAELAAVDAYEASGYRRHRATLRSGRSAWIYVRADPS